MDNYNGNPEEEISALSLELLFSPGLFVIPPREVKSAPVLEEKAVAPASQPCFGMESQPAGQALSEPAATMLARMGQFISGTLLPGVSMTEDPAGARYRVVFTSGGEAFAHKSSTEGIVLVLPDAETLAVSPEGKVRAAEALKRWAAACLEDIERKTTV
jgi:hypothetical protein